MERQKMIVKNVNTIKEDEVFAIAEKLINDGIWAFSIENDGECLLKVDAYEDMCDGLFTDGIHCQWARFNEQHPTLFDECNNALLKAGIYVRDAEGDIVLAQDYEEE